MSDVRAAEIAAELRAAGVNATDDPRSATPPCVLVPPPDLEFDVTCGATARWNLQVLAPGPGNADTHKALAAMVAQVADLYPAERATFGSYVLSPENPAFPAYRIELTEGIET